jgi:SpoVK/Ycf46/Vps4 family AAA+-type ATPase
MKLRALRQQEMHQFGVMSQVMPFGALNFCSLHLTEHRVVNAVLTSLDALKRRPNVLVLCTSNMVQSIDPVFTYSIDSSFSHPLRHS